jgi:hypothetical protein
MDIEKQLEIERNLVIAKFMGYNYPDSRVAAFIVSYELHDYRNDWGRLMPVVEKITGMLMSNDSWENCEPYENCIFPRTFGMRTEVGEYMVRFNAHALHIADTLKEATWMAVFEVAEEAVFGSQEQINQTLKNENRKD